MKDYKVLLEKFWNGSASATEKLQLYKLMIEEEDAIRRALQQDFEQVNEQGRQQVPLRRCSTPYIVRSDSAHPGR